jgi:hypothetical protein
MDGRSGGPDVIVVGHLELSEEDVENARGPNWHPNCWCFEPALTSKFVYAHFGSKRDPCCRASNAIEMDVVGVE